MSGPALSSPILFTSQLLCSAISFRAAALKKKDRPTRYIQPGPPNVEKKMSHLRSSTEERSYLSFNLVEDTDLFFRIFGYVRLWYGCKRGRYLTTQGISCEGYLVQFVIRRPQGFLSDLCKQGKRLSEIVPHVKEYILFVSECPILDYYQQQFPDLTLVSRTTEDKFIILKGGNETKLSLSFYDTAIDGGEIKLADLKSLPWRFRINGRTIYCGEYVYPIDV